MIKKVLIAFDGSEPSKNALNHGVLVAEKFGADIIIISVVPRVMMPVFPDEGFGAAPITAAQEFTEYQERMKNFYLEALSDVKENLDKDSPELRVEFLLEEGRPSSTVVQKAEDENVDLIVIGSRGLGGITGFILGSTSRRIVDSCTKPVLVVK
jgi:nucleotide-binding universal stress UspA family protein